MQKIENLSVLDDLIKTTGLEAAHAVLPRFLWSELKSQWPALNTKTRLAAVILRRLQLTLDVNLAMATEIIDYIVEDAKDLKVDTNGNVKITSLDARVWQEPIRIG